MIRIFKEHKVRVVESLDGLWDFSVQEKKLVSRPSDFQDIKMQVPHAWEIMPGLENYRGRAVYSRAVDTDAGNVRLVFDGVSHTADVYFDGKKAGTHVDAFTPFDCIVKNVRKGQHKIEVRVDNRFNQRSKLHKENDYYSYGGITRPAELHMLADAYIKQVHHLPIMKKNGWVLKSRITLANIGKVDAAVDVLLAVAGKEAGKKVRVSAGKERVVELDTDLLKVKPWTAGKPNMYDAAVTLEQAGEVVDDKIDRIGFREVKVRGTKILLNGKAVKLCGFNRHEDHPDYGCALPVEAMVKDLMIMRDLNVNFIRTSHYPNNRRFLDLCDELGFYVWEESHYRCGDLKKETPPAKGLCSQLMINTEEMVEAHYNHPCIIMWGGLNEGPANERAFRPLYKALASTLRRLDQSRPITHACNKQKRDVMIDLFDIVSWNCYPGWYAGSPAVMAPYMKGIVKWTRSKESKGGAGKPILFSEFGAGAIYGNRDRNAAKWSEEMQVTVLDTALEFLLNDKRVNGVTIWQFCDVRVTGGWFGTRPRTHNNKGVVDDYRRPKLAYDTVKNHYKAYLSRNLK